MRDETDSNYPLGYLLKQLPRHSFGLNDVLAEIRQCLVDPILMREELVELTEGDLDLLGITHAAISKGQPYSRFLSGISREKFVELEISLERLRNGLPLAAVSADLRKKLYSLLQEDLRVRVSYSALLVLGEFPDETRVHIPNLLTTKGTLLSTLRSHDINVQELKNIPLSRIMMLDFPEDLTLEMSYHDFQKYAITGDHFEFTLVELVQLCAPNIKIALTSQKKDSLPRPILTEEVWRRILFAFETKNNEHLMLLITLVRSERAMDELIDIFESKKGVLSSLEAKFDDEHFSAIIRHLKLFSSKELEEIVHIVSWVEALDFGGILAREAPLEIIKRLRTIYTEALRQRQFEVSFISTASNDIPRITRHFGKYAFFRWDNRTFERIVYNQISSLGFECQTSHMMDVNSFVRELEDISPPLLVLSKEDPELNSILRRTLGQEILSKTKILIIEDVPMSNTTHFAVEGKVCMAKFDTADVFQFRKCLQYALMKILDMTTHAKSSDLLEHAETIESKLVYHGYLSVAQGNAARMLWETNEIIKKLPYGLALILRGCPVTSLQRNKEALEALEQRKKSLPENIESILKKMLDKSKFSNVEMDLILRHPDATEEERRIVREEELDMFNYFIQTIKHNACSVSDVQRYLAHHDVNTNDYMSLLCATIDAENVKLLRHLNKYFTNETETKYLDYAFKHKKIQAIRYLLHRKSSVIQLQKPNNHVVSLLKNQTESPFQRAAIAEYLKILFPGRSLCEIISGKTLCFDEKAEMCGMFNKIGKRILAHIYDMVFEELQEIEKRDRILKYIHDFFPQNQAEIARYLLLDKIYRAITIYNEDKKLMLEGVDTAARDLCCQNAISAIDVAIDNRAFPIDMNGQVSKIRDYISGEKRDDEILPTSGFYIPRGSEMIEFIEKCRLISIPSGLAVFEMGQKQKEMNITVEGVTLSTKARTVSDAFLHVERDVNRVVLAHPSQQKKQPHVTDLDNYNDYKMEQREIAAKKRAKKVIIKTALHELRSAELMLDKTHSENELARQIREEMLREEIQLTKQYEALKRRIEVLRPKAQSFEDKLALRHKIIELKVLARQLADLEAKRHES